MSLRANRVAIVQSNYAPWKGYFDLIASVDAFVLYDEVQYTRRDWRNRNRIKTSAGLRWLTVPVEVKGRYHQRIDETLVADRGWARSHLDLLEHAYAAAPHRGLLRGSIGEAYADAARHQRLSDVNRTLLEAFCAHLGITTPLLWSTDIDRPESQSGDRRTGSLLAICVALGAREYVSGPSAREYLDEQAFKAAGVDVRWADYGGYPEYPQPYPPFAHDVSVLDLLLCTGDDAANYLRPGHVAGVR
ncbi:MAG: WbqC family protein [Solirubrobacteraceae bacterium]